MEQPPNAWTPTILLAPLDWGLGHATRCIPVIRYLLNHGCKVIVAGSGKIKILLQAEFPSLHFLELNGYNVRYAKRQWALPWQIVLQVPGIVRSIKAEHLWLEGKVKNHHIDAVISDNRYGLYHTEIPSVFITHQLYIKTPFGKTVDIWLQKLNYGFINRFSACWVPDSDGPGSLAGALSHPRFLPSIPVHYTGPMSRFDNQGVSAIKHLLILLSGPEPQRSLFEEKLVKELQHYTAPVVLVRGLPGSTSNPGTGTNVEVHNHLPAKALQEKMQEASYIISRCGYSTVMDLASLKKKSILVPTPGQTEQEYLADHLMKMKQALCIEQKKFSLKPALDLAGSFDYQPALTGNGNSLEQIVSSFVNQLKGHKVQSAHP